MEKLLNGKAIYSPKGKAGEYAKYACNFYVGCSNDCDYCYCKRGLLGHAMGAPVATLKKCFKDEDDALKVFERELVANLQELQKHGLFFTFTSDPLLPETEGLTWAAIDTCIDYDVPVKLLTKRADFDVSSYYDIHRDTIAFGFTLTGCDDQEPHASTNAERIFKMKELYHRGFKTFASIEPVIDLGKSYDMIAKTIGYCDLYKIGLITGKRNYTPEQVAMFVTEVNEVIHRHNFFNKEEVKVYWKDSVPEFLKIDRTDKCFDHWFCVGADYNIFNK